jgi:hypothetical protein
MMPDSRDVFPSISEQGLVEGASSYFSDGLLLILSLADYDHYGCVFWKADSFSPVLLHG